MLPTKSAGFRDFGPEKKNGYKLLTRDCNYSRVISDIFTTIVVYSPFGPELLRVAELDTTYQEIII